VFGVLQFLQLLPLDVDILVHERQTDVGLLQDALLQVDLLYTAAQAVVQSADGLVERLIHLQGLLVIQLDFSFNEEIFVCFFWGYVPDSIPYYFEYVFVGPNLEIVWTVLEDRHFPLFIVILQRFFDETLVQVEVGSAFQERTQPDLGVGLDLFSQHGGPHDCHLLRSESGILAHTLLNGVFDLGVEDPVRTLTVLLKLVAGLLHVFETHKLKVFLLSLVFDLVF